MTEYFVNFNARTTLFATIDASQTTLQIVEVAASPETPQFRIRIDNELMLVTAVAGTTYTVTRGIEGTAGASHSAAAVITYVLSAEALGGQTDPAPAIPGLRSLGTGAQQAAAGNDARFLVPDGADTLAMRNGANPQTLNLYNTYTDASNWERLRIGCDGTSGFMLTGHAGSGIPRGMIVGTTGGAALYFQTSNVLRWQFAADGNLYPVGDNSYDVGASIYRVRTLYLGTSIVNSGYAEFIEMTEPAAGAVNTARLYVKDNGSGKTQLCVRFNTGAVQVLSTEP